METVIISKDSRLQRREHTLWVHGPQGKTKLPVEQIQHIVLLGESRLNTKVFQLCGTSGIRISMFDWYGNFKGAFEPLDHNPAGAVKLAQARLLGDPEAKAVVAREIVATAVHNKKANLRYYRYRGLDSLTDPLERINAWEERIPEAGDRASLMGIEGSIQEIYLTAWKHLAADLDFLPRVRRPPNNRINCLLSFLNQLVYATVLHELAKTHLEATFGVLHTPSSGRGSLALDLAEVFKPLISDTLIFRMVRKNCWEEGWFHCPETGVCLLTEAGRKNVATLFSERLQETIQGDPLQAWIRRDALKLEKQVLGGEAYCGFKRRV